MSRKFYFCLFFIFFFMTSFLVSIYPSAVSANNHGSCDYRKREGSRALPGENPPGYILSRNNCSSGYTPHLIPGTTTRCECIPGTAETAVTCPKEGSECNPRDPSTCQSAAPGCAGFVCSPAGRGGGRCINPTTSCSKENSSCTTDSDCQSGAGGACSQLRCWPIGPGRQCRFGDPPRPLPVPTTTSSAGIPLVGEIISNPGIPGLKFVNAKISDILSEFIIIAFYLAAFLAFFWFVWGAFQYIVAGGNKENLAKARSRITWAIVGLLITAIAFLVAQFAGEILKPKPGTIPLPGFSVISTAYAAPINIGNEFSFGQYQDLGQGVRALIPAALSIAGVLVTFYFVIGAFKFLTAASDKEALSSGQQMMVHAIIGFILLLISFMVFQFLREIFGIPSFIGL